MAVRRTGNGSRFVVALVSAGAAGISSLVIPAVATAPAAGAATLPRPPGAGPPVAASGMGTTAALDNPRCHKKSPSGDDAVGGIRALRLHRHRRRSHLREGLEGRRRQRRRHVAGRHQGQGHHRRGAAERAGTRIRPGPAEEEGRQVAQHLRERDPRLPAPADEVLRDVGPRRRDQVPHVVGQRRSRAARRRRRDQGHEAVRGVPPHRGGPRRARDRARQGEDPGDGLLHDGDEGEPPGAVPLGSERRAVVGHQLGRGDRQATHREEGRVRGRRRQDADPQVRRGLHPDPRRHRQLQVVLQEVRGHPRQRELVPRERLHVR